MRSPSPSELLLVWEHSVPLSGPSRAVGLLAAASPRTSVEDLGRWSVGRRDARLIGLRRMLFGEEVAGVAACPTCGETWEVRFRLSELAGLRYEDEPHAAAEPERLFREGDYEVSYRLPNSLDLDDLLREEPTDAAWGRRFLLGRCLLSARRCGEPVPVDRLPESVTQSLVDRMEDQDPDADLRLRISCASCGSAWDAPFDVASFLWAELGAWARRTLSDVHRLASAYGWSERDILAMSPVRRQAYLEMSAG